MLWRFTIDNDNDKKYDDNRTDTPTQMMSTKLIGLENMILHTYPNEWKIQLSVLRTALISNLQGVISCKLHLYMPHDILVLVIQFV